MGLGNRVFLKRDLPDRTLVDELSKIPTANICDCMNRMYGLSPGIKLMSNPKGGKMGGVALTVKARPGDNLMIHQALEMGGQGDIVVVSNDGERDRALIGEIMAEYAEKARKISGIIIDGPIRDIDAISQMEIPIYATGYTPLGPYKDGPGEINVPISIGGTCINPGDILIGDRDGIAVIPKSNAEEILMASKELFKTEGGKIEAARNGTSNKKWVMEKLTQIGCHVIDGSYK